ncbi:hypothetical protein D3C87_2133340 [compost metagenome]
MHGRLGPLRRSQPLHLIKALDTFLRLRGLGGLRAEAVDEIFEVRDFPLLVLIRR